MVFRLDPEAAKWHCRGPRSAPAAAGLPEGVALRFHLRAPHLGTGFPRGPQPLAPGPPALALRGFPELASETF